MSAYRSPIPICQVWNWHEIDDGTLARMPSPVPPTLGLAGSKEGAMVVASGACAYLNPVKKGTVRAPQAAFDRLRNKCSAARITPVKCIEGSPWEDGSISATESQKIHIAGQKFTIIRPSDRDAAGKNLPTTAQLAEALRAVPANQRCHTKKIIVSPVAEPGSQPGETTAASAASGKITFYPRDSAQSQNDLDNLLMHESAHNYQGVLWRDHADASKGWKQAIKDDNRSPSQYATAGPGHGEDFCEFYILYVTTRGTVCASIAKQLYPHRWAMMVKHLSQ